MRSIEKSPDLDLEVDQVHLLGNKVKFKVKVILKNNLNELNLRANGCMVYISVVTEKGGVVLDFRRLPLKKAVGIKSFTLETELNTPEDLITVNLNCDEIAGLGKHISISEVENYVRSLPSKDNIEKVPIEISDDEFSDDFEESSDNEKIILPQQKGKAVMSTIGEHIVPLSDISITECSHKCPDKSTCRHYCCKHGIQRRSRKKCKHLCKDKSKCRHICCRDQFDYEQSLDSSLPHHQTTLETVLKIDTSANEISDKSTGIEIFRDINTGPIIILTSSSDNPLTYSDEPKVDFEVSEVIEVTAPQEPIIDESSQRGVVKVVEKKNRELPIFFEKVINKPVKLPGPMLPAMVYENPIQGVKKYKYATLGGRRKDLLSNKLKTVGKKKRCLDELSDDCYDDVNSFEDSLKLNLKKIKPTTEETGDVKITVYESKQVVPEPIVSRKSVLQFKQEIDEEFSFNGVNETNQTTIDDDEKDLLDFLGSDIEFE